MSRRSARQIPIADLAANPDNVRDQVDGVDEIAASIRQHGIINALTVTEAPDGGWLLLAGHRRLAGARRAGLDSVPCFIHHDVTADLTEQTVVMLVENVQRRNLSPMEKARAYGRLRDRGLTPTDIARRTGIAVSSVHSHLALLDVDDETAERIETGKVTAGDAIAAVRVARQENRLTSGKPARGRPVVVEPRHLGPEHPLFGAAAACCDHTRRPKVGTSWAAACGQCWEAVIRADALGLAMPAPTYDEVAVDLAMKRGAGVQLAVCDRAEVVRRYVDTGRSLDDLHRRFSWDPIPYTTAPATRPEEA